MMEAPAGAQRGHRFVNWARTYACTPELYYEPEKTEEIKEILAYASSSGRHVRVVGEGHSPSDISCTDDIMMSLRKYQKVLSINKHLQQVTVQAGITVQDLIDRLATEGLALSNLGSVAEVSLGGLISTGSHGTGADYGVISTQVVAMDILTASGNVIMCSSEHEADIFQSARCSLGALGVILTITLQCEPLFNLHQIQEPSTLDEVLNDLDRKVHGSQHFRFCWFPHTDNVVTWHTWRSSKPLKSCGNWFRDYLVGYYLLEFLYWLSSFFPSLVPIINHLFFTLVHKQYREKVARYDKVFQFECLFKQYVNEWAVPIEKTADVLRELKLWMKKSGAMVHFPVEVRFVHRDNIYLSPCHGYDCCLINIIMYRPYGKYVCHDDYWTAYEKIMSEAGGRPHWAKAHKVTASQFRKLYPQFEQFCQVREQLDPNGMFMNDYIRRVLIGSAGPSIPHKYVNITQF